MYSYTFWIACIKDANYNQRKRGERRRRGRIVKVFYIPWMLWLFFWKTSGTQPLKFPVYIWAALIRLGGTKKKGDLGRGHAGIWKGWRKEIEGEIWLHFTYICVKFSETKKIQFKNKSYKRKVFLKRKLLSLCENGWVLFSARKTFSFNTTALPLLLKYGASVIYSLVCIYKE